ncbi:MAG TPA: ABC transporter substrate-binding protein [Casimicrobiaceae bacterium]|jgi:ABC-type branched-subunit amino acid transport system substrate-binding protein|nr:ABC transporter substrate-binding protein [Casimicrobiaceae bacterium]
MKPFSSRTIQVTAALGLASALCAGPALAQDKTIRVGITIRMMVESGLAYGDILKSEIDDLNAKGGVNGAKVEVILLDDECKPDKGIANVNRFISQNKVHLIVGSTCSSVTLPLVDVTAKEQVPLLVPQSTNTSITQKGSEWVFRVSVSERFYAGVYGKYLGENVGKKIAYLYTTDGAGIAFVKQLQDYMKQNYNVDPVYQAQMQETDLDFRSHLLKIKAENPEILALAGQADALARQAQQSFEVGIPKKVWRVEASSAGNVTYPKLAGDAAIGTTFTQAFNCSDDRPIAKQFVAMVSKKYHFACPDHDFSQSWDAAQIVKQALGKAKLKLTADSLAEDRRAIRDALATVKYEGLASGPIEYCAAPTPQCRDGNRTAVLVQYTKGGENFETKVLARVSFDKDFGLAK